MSRLTLYDLEYIIKKFEPKTREEFSDFGLKLKSIGSGAFRRTFQIVGYNVVVKLPYLDSNFNFSECDIDHSRTEWNAYKNLSKKKKYAKLRPFLPKIYCCTKNGIILMKKYSKTRGERRVLKSKHKALLDTIYNTFGHSCDVYWQNIGLTGAGKLKIFDFGCFPDVL